MKQLKIGVLGGIGPEATGTFYLKLIEKLQSDGLIKENGDFPQILINSIPAPELIFDKVDETQLEMYQKGLFELDKMQPDFIIMVCNTIHLFHKKLQSKITTEIIDLRQVVYDKIKNLRLKNVTIVGTPSTLSSGLYDFDGINYHNPNEEEIKVLSDSVFNFNKGINKDLQKKNVEKIVRKYLSKGSQVVLLACTEFAVMLDSLEIPKLNTIDIMVEYTVERCKKLPPKCEV
jgi:aspartate racemase